MFQDRLQPWATDYPRRLDEALRHCHALSDAELDAASPDALADAIVTEHAAQDIVVQYEALESRTYVMSPPPERASAPKGSPTRFELSLPCTGAMNDLRHAGGSARMTGDKAWLTLQFDVSGAFEPDQLLAVRDQWFASVSEGAAQANLVIKQRREELREAAMQIIAARHATRRAIVRATGALEIPLNQGDTERQMLRPRPRFLTLTDIERASAAGGNEVGLAGDVADAIVEQVRSFALALERSPNTANRLAPHDEETLRDVLLFVLNSNWHGLATGETFLGKGKTDILLRWRNRDAFIGECKFWHGEALFDAGLEQLLGRYTVWRDTRVAMLLFIRDRADVSGVISKAQHRIRAHTRYIGPGDDDSSFRLRAQHDAQKIVLATLIPVVIPQP